MRTIILGLLTFLIGCGGSIESISYDPLEPRSDFLVEVKTTAPERTVRIVSQSVTLADPSGVMSQLPPAAALAVMRSEAAKRGANFLLLERLDSRWRRAHYGTGLKLAEQEPRDSPICSHEEAAEAQAAVVKATGRCLQSLKTSRQSLRAKVLASLTIDAFGGLKSVTHQEGSSKDSLVRLCLLRFAAKESYGKHGDYTCNVVIDMELQ